MIYHLHARFLKYKKTSIQFGEIIFPGEFNSSILQVVKLDILRHFPQKISEPHFLKYYPPQENPLPEVTSPCKA